MTYRIDCLYYSEKYPTGDYDNFLDMYKLVNDSYPEYEKLEVQPWLDKDISLIYLKDPSYLDIQSFFKVVGDTSTSVLAGPLLFVHASILEEEYGEKLSDEELQWIREHVTKTQPVLPDKLRV